MEWPRVEAYMAVVSPQPTENIASKTPGKDANRNHRRIKYSQRRREIDALKRKYTVVQIESDIYQIFISPSDPDFAFDLSLLDVDLRVPQHYPHHGTVTLRVNNTDIPRGHALNVERYFSTLAGPLPDRIMQLDTNLEDVLKLPPQKTVTLVRPKITSSSNAKPAGEPLKLREIHRVDLQEGSRHFEPPPAPIDSVSVAKSSSPTEETVSGPKRAGTELVLPEYYMKGTDVVEIASLSVLIRCGRCKELQVFGNLQSAEYGHRTKPTIKACEKCKLALGVAFRKEFLTTESNTAGFLDLSSSTVVDLLPSSYIGVCSNCSELLPTFKSIELGANREQFCRNCHAKASLQIELFRFDVLSTESLGKIGKGLDVSDRSSTLKLTGGEPLPNDGRCKHYRKSFRWFRFSCCKRVFPCDRCHDVEMDHPADPASRMICGKCSREQRFSDHCRFCSHNYVVRNTGFWEGGKGTRNPVLMSKKDNRKYKRRAPQV